MKCIVCGKEFEGSQYVDPICSHECFLDNYWNKALKTGIVIDGTCYQDGGFIKDPVSADFLGFGGRVFKYIKYGSCEVTTTNNLWLNGKVPEKYHAEDNAEFVR